MLTFPNSGKIIFGPRGTLITGDARAVLDEFGQGRPYITNDSEYDLAFDELCTTTIIRSAGDVDNPADVLRGSERCLDLRSFGRKIFPGETIFLD